LAKELIAQEITDQVGASDNRWADEIADGKFGKHHTYADEETPLISPLQNWSNQIAKKDIGDVIIIARLNKQFVVIWAMIDEQRDVVPILEGEHVNQIP
jgi:hypothetical protein